jgi:MFS family permease
MVRKTIQSYVGIRACFQFAIFFHAATYVTYLMERGGLNLLEVNMVNLGFFLTLMLFEIPTGAVADLFGRRLTFASACCLFALSSLIYAKSQTFWCFVLGEVVGAIGSTLANGAIQAWMVDRIKFFGSEGSPSRVFAVEQYCCGVTQIIGGVLGAYCYAFDPPLTWLLGGLIMGVIALVALFVMKEEYSHGVRRTRGDVLQLFGKSVSAIKDHALNNKVVRFLLVISFVNMLAVMAPNMQWQPFFLSLNSSKVFLGYIVAMSFIAMMFGTLVSTKFMMPFFGNKRAILVGQLLVGVGICATTFFCLPVALTIFVVHEIGRGAWYPLRDTYLHDNIPSDHRATLASLTSTANHVGGIVGLIFCGFLAQYLSITVSWVLSGGIMISTVLLLWKEKKEH